MVPNFKKPILKIGLLVFLTAMLDLITTLSVAVVIGQLVSHEIIGIPQSKVSIFLTAILLYAISKSSLSKLINKKIAKQQTFIEFSLLSDYLNPALKRIKMSSGSDYYTFAVNMTEGELATIFNDFFPALTSIGTEIFFLFFTLIYFICTFPLWVTLLSFCAIYVLSLIIKASRGRILTNQLNRNRIFSETLATLNNLVNGLKESAILGTEDIFFEKYRKVKSALTETKFKQEIENSYQKTLVESLGLALLITYGLGLHLRFFHVTALSSLIIIAFSMRLNPSFSRISNAVSRVKSTTPIMKNVTKAIDENLHFFQENSIKSFHLISPLPGISIEKLCVNIGARHLLDNLNLELVSGDIVAITGPSGAGKTILLETLAGLRNPTSGTIRMNAKFFRNRAYLRQDTCVKNESFLENVLFGRSEIDDDHLSFLSDKLGLLTFLNYEAALGGPTLSGGERQRLGLTRVLVNKPNLIFLDEPTSAQDNSRSEEIMKILKGRKESIIFLVSHNAEFTQIANKFIDLSLSNDA